MAEVEDYTAGRVLDGVRQAFQVFDTFEGALDKSEIGASMLNQAIQFDPKLMGIEGASKLIQESARCAVGERVCRALYPESPYTESVFLDDLAAGMVEVGKARYVTREEAVDTLKKYKGSPIVVSKVSGKHIDICNSWPERCVYWNLERHALRCLDRPADPLRIPSA